MARSSEAQILYVTRPDATPEAELNALAAIYASLLKKKAAGPDDPDNGKLAHKERRPAWLDIEVTTEGENRTDQKGKDIADIHGN